MSTATAEEVLRREFLPLRAKVLELAAALDRIDRAGKVPDDSDQIERLREALETLLWTQGSRAEAVQLIFSRDYDPRWPHEFGLARQ